MNEFAALLSRSGLTLVAAAELLGVSRHTVMNWRDGKSRVPARAMDLMRAYIDMAAQPDATQTDEDRRALLMACHAAQAETIARLERDLEKERSALEETRMILEKTKGN